MTSASPVAVIDALNALLEAELNSIFRFMGEGSPYLSRASAEVCRPLNDMVVAGQRHAMELAEMVDRLGGFPAPKSIQPEEQYLAFLTLKFLLPKLAEAKRLTIERYENTLRALNGAPQEVINLLQSHVAEHQADLKVLEKASAEVLAKKT
jgi:hypothetical protein